MTKTEFMIRFANIRGSKLKGFKQNLINLDDELDYLPLLRSLALTEQQKIQFEQQNITSIMAWLDHENHHLISYVDPLYPSQLKQISAAPLILFVMGDPKILNTPQLAMVGSREFSEYGAQWGRYFAGELAINGLTITSGMALGIDAICHRGALEVSGKTIAVLGSGLCHISPKTNLGLAHDIINNHGAIISEFMPNEKARAEYFPRRNRIISGLSLGTFVVEASEKSGSLITARYALEQNRDVFALPGEITNPNSSGTHWLIKQGAYLVTKPTDILEHYSGSLSWIKNRTIIQPSEPINIIHAEIVTMLNSKPTSLDIIAEKTNQPVHEVAVKLIELELEGLILVVSGGYIRNQIIT